MPPLGMNLFEPPMACEILRAIARYNVVAIPGQLIPESVGLRRRLAESISIEARREFEDARSFHSPVEVNVNEARVLNLVHATGLAVDAVILDHRTYGLNLSAESRQWLVRLIAAECFDISLDVAFSGLTSTEPPAQWARNRLIAMHGSALGPAAVVKDWFVDPLFSPDQSTSGQAGYQSVNFAFVGPVRGLNSEQLATLASFETVARTALDRAIGRQMMRWPVLVSTRHLISEQVSTISGSLPISMTKSEKRTAFAGTVSLRTDGMAMLAQCGVPDSSYSLKQIELFGEFAKVCPTAPRTALVIAGPDGIPANVVEAAGEAVRLVHVELDHDPGAGKTESTEAFENSFIERLPEFVRSAWFRRNEAFRRSGGYAARLEQAASRIAGETSASAAAAYAAMIKASFVDLGWHAES